MTPERLNELAKLIRERHELQVEAIFRNYGAVSTTELQMILKRNDMTWDDFEAVRDRLKVKGPFHWLKKDAEGNTLDLMYLWTRES